MSANPNAMEMLKENILKIDWNTLSINSNAITFLIENINYIIMEEPKPIINSKYLPNETHSTRSW